jgi:DNA-binding LytR/AlgR family response regulator
MVEDNLLEAQMLKKHLSEFAYNDVIHVKNSTQMTDVLRKETIDFVIMDIELADSKKNGIELVKDIREKHKIPTLFLSNHSSDDILEKIKAVIDVDFELKPIDAKRLDFAIRRILKRYEVLEEESSVISLESSDVFFLKPIAGIYSVVRKSEITHLEADSSGTTIYHGDKSTFVYISLEKMVERLFHLPLVRTHQTYAVAVNAIKTISDIDVELTNGSKVALSRNYRRILKYRLDELMISN